MTWEEIYQKLSQMTPQARQQQAAVWVKDAMWNHSDWNEIEKELRKSPDWPFNVWPVMREIKDLCIEDDFVCANLHETEYPMGFS